MGKRASRALYLYIGKKFRDQGSNMRRALSTFPNPWVNLRPVWEQGLRYAPPATLLATPVP